MTVKKIINSINTVARPAKKIIVHGIQFSIGLLIIALILHFINNKVYIYNYYTVFIGFITAKTSVAIFAQAVIGGLFLDYIFKKL